MPSSPPPRPDFARRLLQLIEKGRDRKAGRKVELYWTVGRLLSDEESHDPGPPDWHALRLQGLSERLLAAGLAEWKPGRLRQVRQFFQTFPEWTNALVELNWSHYQSLLRLEPRSVRNYYLWEALTNQWSSRELRRQIRTFYYQRSVSAASSGSAPHKLEPESLLKDPYILEFLPWQEAAGFLEKELEAALLDKLQQFLLELGKGFAFVARQKRIHTPEGRQFYVDLVFYHYLLRCFVLIDLKTGRLDHSHIGQMDMYVRLFDEKWRGPDDNPTLGIILCAEKDQTIVKYSMLQDRSQLFASTYQLHLPSQEQLADWMQAEKDPLHNFNF